MTNHPDITARYSDTNPVDSLIEAVFVRPQMYTINGTVEEAAAFLQGFASGIGGHRRDPALPIDPLGWWAFCAWMHQALPESRSPAWYDVFRALRERYPDDHHIRVQLLDWYQHFRQVRDTSQDP